MRQRQWGNALANSVTKNQFNQRTSVVIECGRELGETSNTGICRQ